MGRKRIGKERRRMDWKCSGPGQPQSGDYTAAIERWSGTTCSMKMGGRGLNEQQMRWNWLMNWNVKE